MTELQIFHCQQGSLDWFNARLGIATASNFKAITSKGKGDAASKTRSTYMYKLAGERITGQLAEAFGDEHTERGHAWEDTARKLYAMLNDVDPALVGFLRRGDVGASPDSLVGEAGLLEIKTRLPHLQIELLLANEIPKENVAQLQGQMWVAGREWSDYLSYSPGLPPFLRRIERDESFTVALAVAVWEFNEELNELVERIKNYGVKA